MKKSIRNIYQIARKNTNFTQEKAAELLNVSSRSLADYELGKTIPGDDIVCEMIDIYKTPWLGYQHLKESTMVGQKYLPEINLTDLAKSVLKFQKEVKDIDTIDNDMIDIACDWVVDQSEENRWEKVTKEISEMAAAAFAVMYSQKEKSRLKTAIK